MREKNSHFVNEIYKYCDENVGEKVLFSVFTNLYNEEKFIIKRDLVGITEKIINNLIKEEILIEIVKPKGLESFYGYYEVKPHEDLMKKNGYIKKKIKMLG